MSEKRLVVIPVLNEQDYLGNTLTALKPAVLKGVFNVVILDVFFYFFSGFLHNELFKQV